MNRLASRSLVASLVFCVAFAGAAYGAGGIAASPAKATTLWGLLCGTWTALSKTWQEEGSSLDPFGLSGSTSQSDAGSQLDPFGNPATSNSDAGSSLDPFGKP